MPVYCGLAGLKGTGRRVEIIEVCASLRGMAWLSGDCAGQSRPEGHNPAKIINVCGSPVWLALRALSSGDHAGLRVGSLGVYSLGGLRSGPKDQRSHGLQSSCSMGLCGRAWHALLAILLVYGGVEKPSMS
jgi:hypothetical protein